MLVLRHGCEHCIGNVAHTRLDRQESRRNVPSSVRNEKLATFSYLGSNLVNGAKPLQRSLHWSLPYIFDGSTYMLQPDAVLYLEMLIAPFGRICSS